MAGLQTMTRPGHEAIGDAVRAAAGRGQPAIVGFMTAGFPDKATFLHELVRVANTVDVLEIGVPFTDPMADGMTIQRASHRALSAGVSLVWILESLGALSSRPSAPLLLMSYLNPLLAYGMDRLPAAARAAGVSGFIVPDLPHEESADLRSALEAEGVALVQMVTPVTPPDRLAMLCREAKGFIYAVTMTGTTGKTATVPADLTDYLRQVRSLAPVPVCAGFGIRSAEQVRLLKPDVDGVVVGSALVEVLERGDDPVAFVQSLRD